MNRAESSIILFVGLLSGGCTAISLDELSSGDLEADEQSAQPVETFNALTTNALTTNALTTNALTTNALTTNALTTNALTTNALTTNGITTGSLNSLLQPALQDPSSLGEQTRYFFRYLIGCALAPAQFVQFSWTDSGGAVHNESYAGGIGLAPNWMTGAPSQTDQDWVSACLAARTNWYGVSVPISARGAHQELKHNPAGEFTEYPVLEGAFWGSIFSSTPQLYACYDSAEIANARARNRDCAVGHLAASGVVETCGLIQIMGECADYCKNMHNPGQYLKSCGIDNNHHKNETITIWLHE